MTNLKIKIPLTLNKSIKKERYSLEYIYRNFYTNKQNK